MLELKNICYSRNNKDILKNININIATNTFVAITGQNGSGKSTLAKIIMGIEKPDSGKIIYNNVDITEMSINERAKLGISFAFQQPVTFKGITVKKLLNIASGENKTKEELCNTLSKVGLSSEEYIDRELDTKLSGGELKRIEIASIIEKKGNLNIFDEPEAGIDLWSFRNLVSIFNEIKENRTTLIISHQERILKIADEIIVINKGEVEKKGHFNNLNLNNESVNICDKLNECYGNKDEV